MGFIETDCNLCKSCYITIKKPLKKVIKKMELTSYKTICEACGRENRIVEYIWEPDEEEAD